MCIAKRLDFVIIAGDLFDTSLPSIDILRRTAAKLRQCKEAGLVIYAIPGSHDYSPTGKTMLSVLEDAGLLVDVCKFSVEEDGDRKKIRLKFTEDRKTGVKLTGIMGRKGGLDVDYYKDIDKSIEKEPGPKIFVFHAAIAEYRPENMKDMLAVSIAELPKGFSYYATGHVHKMKYDKENKIVFPGELFPTSFDELEDYNGSFVIVDMNEEGEIDVKWQSNKLFGVEVMKINVDSKKPLQVEQEITEKMGKSEIRDKILLLKLEGLLDGKISDIDFRAINMKAYEAGARIMKRSTTGIRTKEFEEVHVEQNMSTDEIEKKLVEEHAEQMKIPSVGDIHGFVVNLMHALKDEKGEDETNATFESRLKENAKKVLGL